MCGIVGYTGDARGEPDPAGRACVGWNIAATTARGSPPSTTSGWSSASGPGGSGCWRSCSTREPAPGACGISHTRWATHGPANDRNAHPHLGGRRRRRRGRPQRRDREPRGPAPRAGGRRVRVSQPDRHRGHRPPDRPRAAATATTCSRPCSASCPGWKGPTAWRSSARGVPAQVVGARLGSPLVVGVGEGEHLLASDPVGHRPAHRAASPTSRTARSSG